MTTQNINLSKDYDDLRRILIKESLSLAAKLGNFSVLTDADILQELDDFKDKLAALQEYPLFPQKIDN